ncbi:MAG: transcriptional regulator, TetR family [Marmoricola sp.]|nr:transcriptional regulator, TetR family [Marmoricola sp.]
MTARRRFPPVQARSRATVEKILDGATRVLSSSGYAAMSTNRVADEAGVSVGSLYRYFADKDEIFEELRSRAGDAVLARITGSVTAVVGQPARAGVRTVIAALVTALEENGPVVRALINEVPMGTQSNVLPEIERGLGTFTRIYVAQMAPGMPGAEMDARIYLAMGITLNSCLRIALERPSGLDREHLIDLVADMLALGLSETPLRR